MKKLISVIILTSLLLCSCGGPGILNGKNDTSDTAEQLPNEIWTREDVPTGVRYDRMWVYSDYATTNDLLTINDLINGIKALKIVGVSDMMTTDYTDILTFTFADGTTERFEFENQCWVDGETRYIVEGLDRIRTELDYMLREFGGLDHPPKFAAQPYKDDRDGLYWIFYDGGYGARFESFANGELVGATLFKWGVEDGTLYIFPQDGEKEEYPVSYEEDRIILEEFNLDENYDSVLEPLYPMWTDMGKQIKTALDIE